MNIVQQLQNCIDKKEWSLGPYSDDFYRIAHVLKFIELMIDEISKQFYDTPESYHSGESIIRYNDIIIQKKFIEYQKSIDAVGMEMCFHNNLFSIFIKLENDTNNTMVITYFKVLGDFNNFLDILALALIELD